MGKYTKDIFIGRCKKAIKTAKLIQDSITGYCPGARKVTGGRLGTNFIDNKWCIICHNVFNIVNCPCTVYTEGEIISIINSL